MVIERVEEHRRILGENSFKMLGLGELVCILSRWIGGSEMFFEAAGNDERLFSNSYLTYCLIN